MVGGRTCLDFVNTASQRRTGPFSDKLTDYEALLDWAIQSDQLTEKEAADLRTRAAKHPRETAVVVERARTLREAIYRVFAARVAGESLPVGDLQVINDEHSRAAVNRVLTPVGMGKCSFEWRTHEDLDRPLWPVAISAVNLAASDDAARVKECGNDNCNWLFLDTSKNRSRRWCDMKECGNRAKVKRHYERHRQGS